MYSLSSYDPNTSKSGTDVSSANGATVADIKFQTIGAGYLWYIDPNVRLLLYYEHPMNEKTSLAG